MAAQVYIPFIFIPLSLCNSKSILYFLIKKIILSNENRYAIGSTIKTFVHFPVLALIILSNSIANSHKTTLYFPSPRHLGFHRLPSYRNLPIRCISRNSILPFLYKNLSHTLDQPVKHTQNVSYDLLKVFKMWKCYGFIEHHSALFVVLYSLTDPFHQSFSF